MDYIFLFFTAVFYVLGTLAYLSFLIFQRKKTSQMAITFLYVGYGFHTLFIILRFKEIGIFPVTNFYESLSFFCWLMIAGYLGLRLRFKIEVMGAFISPLATIMIIPALRLPKNLEIAPVLQSFWFPIHVTFAFLGNAILALAFCGGIMYLLQENQLKSKKIGAFYHRLPSLEALDELNYKCLAYGFFLITLGILTGSIWAKLAWGSFWNWEEPRMAWSFVIWLLYAGLIHARLTVGWRGRKAALLAILGFVAVISTFLGVNLITKGKHSF